MKSVSVVESREKVQLMEWYEDGTLEPGTAAALDLLADEDEAEETSDETAMRGTLAIPSVCLPGSIDIEETCAGTGRAADTSHLRSLARDGDWPLLEPAPRLGLTPRLYQEDALDAWTENGGRGVIALPTGAGKTVVAFMAIARAGVRPLIVVPTLELLKQWTEGLRQHLSLPSDVVGRIGGGTRQLRAATVITYDSAWRRPRDLRAFGLLVFDEVHHLPSASYRRIAEVSEAPFRLGLTATPERADLLHHDLERLVGPVVFRRSPGELARSRHIARFRQQRIFIDLTDEEEYHYSHLMSRFQWYMARNRLRGQGFQQLVLRAASDPAAREALRCHQQARQVALNAQGKAEQVLTLLRRHRDDRVLVFCEYTAVVDSLSQRFLLPAVTYRTPAAERRQTLERFRSGAYTKLVSGRVLNEGVDVPDANVAIVVSGSATPREQIQRLGRVLRPKEQEAVLYEIVARGTCEERAARSRKVKG
jgi:superfamily II DNA or RNA helicase